MITLNINVTRIDKAHLYEGKSGKYLSLVLFENKDGPDQYGNDGFVTQGVSKEERAKGVKGPIIGNWKNIETKPRQQTTKPRQQDSKPTTAPTKDPDEDDVPF